MLRDGAGCEGWATFMSKSSLNSANVPEIPGAVYSAFKAVVTIFLLFHNLLLLVCSRRVHILFGMCRYDYVSLLLVVHPFQSHLIVL